MSAFYKHPYYICNFILCLIYPLIRYLEISPYLLYIRDSYGYKKETQIVTGVLVIIVIRYIRYFSNFKQFIADALFYIKTGILIILFFIQLKLFAWYSFACIGNFICITK